MKKSLIFLILCFAFAKLYGQGYYDVKFAGASGVSPKTVLVENLTKGTSVNVQGTDVLRLNLVTTGVSENVRENNKLVIFPNPMEQSCNFEFYNASQGRVHVQLYSNAGKLLCVYSRDLFPGNHRFLLSGVPSGIYLLNVKTETGNMTGRFISKGGAGAVIEMSHEGGMALVDDAQALFGSQSNLKSTQATVSMNYSLGDKLKFVGSADGYANNSVYASPTSSSTYNFVFSARYYRITPHKISTDVPCFVNVMFSVKDLNYKGVDNLANGNFTVKEDGLDVSVTESFRYVRSINTIPYKTKTVLMIDNSSSIKDKLSDLKSAALAMVDNIGAKQEIAVYVFSDQAYLLQDFTNDVALLKTAINGIAVGYASTNLYGSFVTGVNAWNDEFSTTLIQKGCLVLFTDGDDTQGSSTLQQAIAARGEKSTYIIGLGNSLTPSILNQLANPSPYYGISSISELSQLFKDIQHDIFVHANSFYWLNYMTPKRTGNHTLRIDIANNGNSGTDSYYAGSFSAAGFQSVLSGVYLNKTSSALYGIDAVKVPATAPFNLEAVTYWASLPPSYTWSSANQGIATVTPDKVYFNKSVLNFPGTEGTTTVTVKDVANNYTKDITVTVQGKPTVSTEVVAAITYTTATCGGNVIADGGATVTQRGVVWSTGENPTISLSTKTYDSSGNGTYTSKIAGLQPGTTYYVRAYATNSVGTSYGEQVTFTTTANGVPVVTTNTPTNVNYTTATGGGVVTSTGGINMSVTARGICWSTTENPTIGLSTKTSNGTGIGSFTGNITGLSAGTTYYVRAYATNSIGTGYGEQITFTTLAPPQVVTTNAATAVSYTTATCGGNITADGGYSISARGICWGTTANPTVADNKIAIGNGTGTFTTNLSGLTDGTTYYIRAYATNSLGTAYGEQQTFTTLSFGLPTLTTNQATAVSYNTATCGGVISADGGYGVTARGVCWSTSENPTTADSYISSGSGAGSFTINVTGLTVGTNYKLRAYATNSLGTAYGEQISITTLSLPQIVTTNEAVVSHRSVTCGGNVTVDGGYSITARGVCWSTSESPTIADNKTTNGSGKGMFTSSITELTLGATYYLRAYATNSLGTVYGDERTFTITSYGPFTDARDGNVYQTVVIGKQVWMAENLKYLPSVVGPSVGSATVPYYYVYGYNGTVVATAKGLTNYKVYGVLYNWQAAKISCPAGWHLPSDEELIQLNDYLGGATVAGGKMKETGSTHWTPYNYGATNSSGFTALPGGSVLGGYSNSFNSLGTSGIWWGSTIDYLGEKARHMVMSGTGGYWDFENFSSFAYGRSIRCIKD